MTGDDVETIITIRDGEIQIESHSNLIDDFLDKATIEITEEEEDLFFEKIIEYLEEVVGENQ